MTPLVSALRCLCGQEDFEPLFQYTAPPPGETRFSFSTPEAYRRSIYKCRNCLHCLSIHDFKESSMYSGDYVDSTYGASGLLQTFQKINALDPSKSDNLGRVKRILEFGAAHFSRLPPRGEAPRILDVGSGLCVFLYQMKAAGWSCTALDPDPRAAEHARQAVGIYALCGDFMSMPIASRFDCLTLNKVLEHVKDPVAMLSRAHTILEPEGFVYIELPDAEAAAEAGQGREEFFIEHHHIFSFRSVAMLAEASGFRVMAEERLQEPSTKYTLRAFLVPARSCAS